MIRARTRPLVRHLLLGCLVVVCGVAAHASARMLDGATQARSERPPAERFQWAGERVVYDVYLLQAVIARANIQVGVPRQHESYGLVYPIDATLRSHGLAGVVYAMRNEAQTWVDLTTGQAVYTDKVLDERGRRRRYRVHFFPTEYRAVVDRTIQDTDRRFRRLVPSQIHDGLSWLVDLRSRPLEVGHQYIYYIYDGWKLSRLTVRVEAHEFYATPTDVFPAARMAIRREVLESEPLFPWSESVAPLPPYFYDAEPGYGVGMGWVTTDEHRIPLAFEIRTTLGLVRMVLSEHHRP